MRERGAHLYAEGVRRGCTLVSAKVEDHQPVPAQAVLDEEHSVDLTARERVYRDEGWSSFDPDAPIYTDEGGIRERERYRA